MTDKKKDGIVEYTDVEGNTRWAAEDSKAYQDHLANKKSRPASKSSSESAKTEVKS